MKTSLTLLITAGAILPAMLSFCAKEPVPGRDSQENDGTESPAANVRLDTTIIVTGVEFPEGYDWKRDTAYGTIDCKIVMFKNWERVMTVPAGESDPACGDPDMHRIVDGSLYTEYSSPLETILTRDGKTLFSYPGRELVCGMVTDGEGLWMLGQDRDGKGFTLRKDGKEIMRSENGIIPGRMDSPMLPTGALYKDGDRLCFAWKTVEIVGVAKKTDWHLYCDGEVTDIPYSQSSGEVCDIRMAGGVLCMITAKRASGSLTLIAGDSVYDLRDSEPFTTIGGRIIPREGGVMVTADVVSEKGKAYSCLWDGQELKTRVSGSSVTFSVSGDKIASVSCEEDGSVYMVNGLPGNLHPGKYTRMMSPSCLCTARGSVYLALTSDRGKPFIVSSDGKKEVDINGYLTSITVSITETIF